MRLAFKLMKFRLYVEWGAAISIVENIVDNNCQCSLRYVQPACWGMALIPMVKY